MRATKRKDGEYIEMEWDGEACFYELVRGWPGEDAAREAVRTGVGGGFHGDWKFRECYAANLQTSISRANGYEYEIRLFGTHGRGRYRVSVLENPSRASNVAA